MYAVFKTYKPNYYRNYRVKYRTFGVTGENKYVGRLRRSSNVSEEGHVYCMVVQKTTWVDSVCFTYECSGHITNNFVCRNACYSSDYYLLYVIS